MRSFGLVVACFMLPLVAREREDRIEIERTVSAITEEGNSDLFTADAQGDVGRLTNIGRKLREAAGAPMSEVSRPRIVVQSVRFITPDVAFVDASNAQYGSLILARRIPLIVVLRRDSGRWRIAALRVLLDLMDLA